MIIFTSLLVSLLFANPCKQSLTDNSTREYSGPKTHFNDPVYACYEWNGKAKKAMKQNHYFAASNYKLASTVRGSQYELRCGGGDYLCAKSADGVEYTIIDYCDESNCDFHTKNHIDILVRDESTDGNTCTKGCKSYNNFQLPWKLVTCSNQLNPDDF